MTLSAWIRIVTVCTSVVALSCGVAAESAAQDARPNVLLITVDDMSLESIGIFGCRLKDTTPTIDRLAQRGFRFNHAHTVVANCMPSRNVMWSGLYPHHTGVEGFFQVRDAKYLHLVDLMKAAGYYTAIRGKVTHSTPYSPYAWDAVLDELPDGTKAHPKNVKSYGISTADGIRRAREAGKPFCLLINVSDPHKPFYAEGRNGQTVPDPNVPSRVFTPAEVPIPGFLFDDPVVRKELSHYYSTVRRADDCVAEILASLRAAGAEGNTLIVFLSDHGMPLPFSKTQVYHDSTHTPLFFVWPGKLPAATVDDLHMVSTVDLLPTLLDLLNIRHPGTMDGRSFAGLLRGDATSGGRDWIIKEYNENAGGFRNPMRAIQDLRDLYIFNPWSDGKRLMATATRGTPTYHRMAQLAQTDPAVAAREDLFLHRVPEEFYIVADDPDCLHNRLTDAAVHPQLETCRARLDEWMAATADPMLDTFRKRDDPTARAAYMTQDEAAAAARKAARTKHGGDKQKAPPHRSLIAFALPDRIVPGAPVTVKIRHTLPPSMGRQILTVTLKAGDQGARLDRKTVEVEGNGVAAVALDVPTGVDDSVSFAAFVGDDFKKTPQHITSKAIPVVQQ